MRCSMSLCLSFLLFYTALAIAAPVPLPQARDVDPSRHELKQPNNISSVAAKIANPSLYSSASDNPKNTQSKQDGSKSRNAKGMVSNSWGPSGYNGMKKLRRRR